MTNLTTAITEIKSKISMQEWEQRKQDCQSSGKSVKAWCLKIGISAGSYYYHLRKIRESVLEEHLIVPPDSEWYRLVSASSPTTRHREPTDSSPLQAVLLSPLRRRSLISLWRKELTSTLILFVILAWKFYLKPQEPSAWTAFCVERRKTCLITG